MNVTVAESVIARLRSSSSRARLEEDAVELQAMIYKSQNPSLYGMGPGDGRVLTGYSISLAQNARTAIDRALRGLDASIATLRAEIDGQGAATARTETLRGVWDVFDQFLPYPRLIRQYQGAGGRTTYGGLIRNERDPRRNMSSRVVLSYRGPYNSTTWISRVNDRWTASRWGWLKRTGEAFVSRVQNVASGLVSRIPNSAVQGVLRGGARLLGPVGVIVGGVMAFNDGYTTQMRRDEGSDYSQAQMEQRAQTRGTVTAVATTVGIVAGAAVGAAIGGPVGAVLGGMLGGWLGGLAGDAISDAILD